MPGVIFSIGRISPGFTSGGAGAFVGVAAAETPTASSPDKQREAVTTPRADSFTKVETPFQNASIPFDPLLCVCYVPNRMLLTVWQPVRTENLPGGDSLLTFFKETGPTAKVVLAILFFFSLVSWIIIFAKFLRLRRIGRQSEKFIAFFRKSKRFSEVNTIASQLTDSPLTTLFKAGYAELDAQVKANRPEDPAVTASGAPAGKLLIKNITGVERALERAIGVEMSRLTRNMTF